MQDGTPLMSKEAPAYMKSHRIPVHKSIFANLKRV